MEEEKHKELFEKIDLWYVVLSIIGLTVVIAIISNALSELSNNITLVVEIGVGITIALIIYRMTKKSEKQNQLILDEVKNIVKEEKELRDNKRENLSFYLYREHRFYAPKMDDLLKGKIDYEKMWSMMKDMHKAYQVMLDDYKDVLNGDEIHLFKMIVATSHNIYAERLDGGSVLISDLHQINYGIIGLKEKFPFEEI